MHLVIVHGYLLSGTGSNIYCTNVAKTWKRLGHAVTVVCQDRNAGKLDFVDEHFIGTNNVPATAPNPGSIRVVVPDIDNLLLVYVFNQYEGFTVKEMGNSQCSFDEIENYIDKTSAGLSKVLMQGVDRILTNHAILSPAVTKRASKGQVPYDIKIHGSSLNFSLKQRPELLKYALEGLCHCEKIVAGTSYICKLLDETFAQHAKEIGLHHKKVVIPPGMDPNVFQLIDTVKINQQRFLEKIKVYTDKKPTGRQAQKIVLPNPASTDDLHKSLTDLTGTYDQWAVDYDLIQRWPAITEDEPVIVYFGSYLNTKGVGEVLVSFPAILNEIPKARLLIIGYGGYREHMEGILASMESGDIDAFIAFCQAGSFLDASADQLRGFFRKISQEERQRITITGIMEHSQICEVLPMASISIVGSKCAEAFGMVTVEAMCSGVLPLSNYHSGLEDILDVVKKVDPSLEAIMHIRSERGGKFGSADGSVLLEELPKKVIDALNYLYPNAEYSDQTQRRKISEKLRSIAVENFSWDKICMSLLEPLH